MKIAIKEKILILFLVIGPVTGFITGIIPLWVVIGFFLFLLLTKIL